MTCLNIIIAAEIDAERDDHGTIIHGDDDDDDERTQSSRKNDNHACVWLSRYKIVISLISRQNNHNFSGIKLQES